MEYVKGGTDNVWDDSFSKMMSGFAGAYEILLNTFSVLECFKLHI